MAYDLVVGKSPKARDAPAIVGEISFDELPHLASLIQHKRCNFLQRISNIFEDQCFSLAEVEAARRELHELLPMRLKPGERAVLHKLLSVLSFASARQQDLFGVAD
jgi:hypothetical protein